MALRLSTKARYGTRAICCIAHHHGHKKPVSIPTIAHEENIPIRYLEQILSHLRREGFIKSVRGPSGGYRLKRAPDRILLGEMIQVLEEDLNIVWCVDPDGTKKCVRQDNCVTHKFWESLNQLIKQTLDSVSIQDLLNGNLSDNNLNALLVKKGKE